MFLFFFLIKFGTPTNTLIFEQKGIVIFSFLYEQNVDNSFDTFEYQLGIYCKFKKKNGPACQKIHNITSN